MLLPLCVIRLSFQFVKGKVLIILTLITIVVFLSHLFLVKILRPSYLPFISAYTEPYIHGLQGGFRKGYGTHKMILFCLCMWGCIY